ncbi:sigma-54 interaction domain-containing protein [Pseudalkalibacillus caeni]|uniref:HTH-type transcriptional regulatory protein TyrR n=1 Tax=Exobacillus caeni TaxID=2574798 RepID=A0A5R9F866_9BACL|nr:sigma 54-interacting transcriptional regulator [Pseudalkalibacillus caeni]TLS38440.1 PAS domain-containing protein [Pseudalkalibacillus caeni]
MKKTQKNFDENEAVLHSLKDDILVTNLDGTILKVTDTTSSIYGVHPDDLIGRSVYDLEQEGVFTPIITPLVLKEKKKQTIVQSTREGKKLLVTGVPVLDKDGKLWRVVSYSHDITELMKMKSYFLEMQDEMDRVKNELKLLRDQNFNNEGIIAKDREMKKSLMVANQVAEVDVNVLLLGESGVGKTQLAKYIHNNSPRKNEPFIEVNCGAIPQSLFEAEFFGYESGSFSGAKSQGKIGLVELAEGGTLFLDEIGELPLEHQVKVLKFIQEKSFYRVGGTKVKKVDFRLISATNQPLEKLVEEKRFREDLFYRLNVIPITIPPLRKRSADIVLLIKHFLDVFSKKHNRERELDEAVMQQLLNNEWKGNVRELMNLMERLIVTSSSPIISIEDLPDGYVKGKNELASFQSGQQPLKAILKQVEKRVLNDAKQTYKTTTEVAKHLGISQPSVVRKFKEYGIK